MQTRSNQDAYKSGDLRFGWARTFAGKWDLEAFAEWIIFLDEQLSLGNGT